MKTSIVCRFALLLLLVAGIANPIKAFSADAQENLWGVAYYGGGLDASWIKDGGYASPGAVAAAASQAWHEPLVLESIKTDYPGYSIVYSYVNAITRQGHLGVAYAGSNYGQSCPDGSYIEGGLSCTPADSNNLGDPGGYCNSGNNDGSSDSEQPPCSEGNPISAAVGNKFQMETDYIGSPNTHLELRRYYNSQDPSGSAFGAKWHSTYHRGLTRPDSSTVKVTRADGQVTTFILVSGVWKSAPDVIARLTAVSVNGTQTGWKLVTANDNSEAYDLNGRLLSITERNGLVTNLSYDASNNLTQVTGPFGHVLSFVYDSFGRVTQAIRPDGKAYSYSYRSNTDIIQNVSYFSESTGQYISRMYFYFNSVPQYEGGVLIGVLPIPGKELTKIRDENGNDFASFTYDTDGHALSSSHAGGVEQTTLSYNADGTTTATDAKGISHIYKFLTTKSGKVKPIKISGTPCPSCGGQAFTYDANGFLSGRTDWNGNITKYTHNTRGLETSRTEAFGTPQARTTTTAWHKTYRLPTLISEPDRTITLSYDAKGNLTKKTVTAASQTRIWTYTYNAYGQVTSINAPRSDVNDITRFVYDAKGNLISVTDALGNVTKITAYDDIGQPLTIVDPNGLTTNLTYDFKGRVTSRNVGGELTQYVYDNVGQLLQVVQAHPGSNGTYTIFAYDEAHRLTQISDVLGNKIVYTLDALGNQTAVQVYDPAGVLVRSRTQEFDALNRLAKSINAQGQAFSYSHDNNGNLTGATDPLNNTSSQSYDPLNRLIASIDPIGNKTAIEYDNHDNPVKITDPRGAATAYTYNGLDDKTQTASPDTGTTQNTYDAAGNLLTSTDARGKTTTYAYDALNRVKSISFVTGTPITFSYDKALNAKGRLIKIADETGSTSWTYDSHGRVTAKIQTIGTVTLKTAYAYDTSGRLSKLTYPSGKAVNVAYDTNGQVAELDLGTTPILSNIQYSPFSSPISWTWGNNQTYSRTFDQNGRLTAYPLGDRSRTLSYDPASRISDYTDSDPSQSQNFSYDPLSRLLTASIGAGSTQESLTYDTNSNRLSKTVQTATTAQTAYIYGSTGNRLTQETPQGKPAINYTYDAAGNTLSDGVNTYTYSDRGRLSAVNANQYAVNGSGQRVKKTTPQGTTLFVYDEAGHLIGEYTDTKKTIRETVYFGNTPVAVIAGGVTSYIHADHLNAPRAIVDGTGKTVWRWDSEPFGADKPNEDPDKDGKKFTYNLRFPGQYYDAETGLHYNYFRDYSPSLGRYIESDPIGLGGGLNTYGYVSGNPVSLTDSRGECPWCIAFGVGVYLTAEQANAPSSDESAYSTSSLDYLENGFLAAGLIPRGIGALAGKCVVDAGKTADRFRRTPNNLMDQMVFDAAKEGKGIKIKGNLNDPRFKGMDKYSYGETSVNGYRSEVHYVRDPLTGKMMDFKFK